MINIPSFTLFGFSKKLIGIGIFLGLIALGSFSAFTLRSEWIGEIFSWAYWSMILTFAMVLAGWTGLVFWFLNSRIQNRESSAQAKLQELNGRLERIAKTTNEGVWDWCLETDKHWWNENRFRLFGLDPMVATPSMNSWLSQIDVADRDRVKCTFEAAIAGDEDTFSIEYRFFRADGSFGNAFEQAYIERNGAGRAIQVISALIDVTQQKAVGELMRQNEERFRMVFENSPLGMTIINLEFRFDRVNKRFCEMLGYTEEELLQLTFADITHEEDINIDVDLAKLAFKGEIPYFQIEKRYYRKNGELRWVKLTASVVFDEEKKPVYGIGMVEDITQQKENEVALRKSREHLRIMLHSLAEAVIATDETHCITHINPVAEQLTGYSPAEAIGQHLFDIFHLEIEGAKADSALEARVLTGEFSTETEGYPTITDRKGKKHQIDISGAVIQDDAHQAFGIVLVFRDMTDRLKIEQELLRVEKLNSLGVLAGGIAHDFNNILTGLFGNLELAKRTAPADGKVVKYVDRARSSMDRAVKLTEQLLTFAKGGAPIKEPVFIGDVIIDTAEFSLRGSNIKLETKIDENLHYVCADKGQLSQVIGNLVINAQQAMSTGGTISIEAQNVDREIVQISVRDEGSGIPEAQIDKIFDPYFTTKENGNGLGLASTHSIIQRHGGQITVDSAVGEGTVFNIYLQTAEQEQPATIRSTENGVPESLQSSGSILVVDDDETVGKVLLEMLGEMGFEVVFMESGERAAGCFAERLTEQAPFDLVITDLTIPGGMDGLETAQAIWKLDPEVQIIISSGYANNRLLADYSQHGFAGIVTKPYRFAELETAVLRVLQC